MQINFSKSEEISGVTTTLVQADLGGDSVLYLAVSESAVSGALIREEEGMQKLAYCHSLNGPQT